jgi:hypothetical protein
LDRVFGRIADHDAAAAEDRAERDALRRDGNARGSNAKPV